MPANVLCVNDENFEKYWLILVRYYLIHSASVRYCMNESKPVLTISTETMINQSS